MKSAAGARASSRILLRLGLSLIFGNDLLRTAQLVAREHAAGLSNPMAPRFFLAIGGHPPTVAAIALIGSLGVVLFALRRWPITGGFVALGAMLLLAEAHSATSAGPGRYMFQSGTTLLGWLGGLVFARINARMGNQPVAASVEVNERYAEYGALGTLAATYMNAAISKLSHSGSAWLDANSIRSLVLSEHSESYVTALDRLTLYIVNHQSILTALAFGTLVCQLGAFMLLVGPRSRALWATMLIVFHGAIWTLSDISYISPMLLLALFGYPWARLDSRSPVEVGSWVRPSARAQALWLLGLYSMVVAAWLLPLRQYNSLYPMYRAEREMVEHAEQTTQPRPLAEVLDDVPIIPPGWKPKAMALLAPLTLGVEVAPGYRLAGVTVVPEHIAVRLEGIPPAELELDHPRRHLTNEATPSFTVQRGPTSWAGNQALALVIARVRANDDGHFWPVRPKRLPPPPGMAPATAPPSAVRSLGLSPWARPLVLLGGLLLVLAAFLRSRQQSAAAANQDGAATPAVTVATDA